MTVIGGSRRLSGEGLQCHSVMFRVPHTFAVDKIFVVAYTCIVDEKYSGTFHVTKNCTADKHSINL